MKLFDVTLASDQTITEDEPQNDADEKECVKTNKLEENRRLTEANTIMIAQTSHSASRIDEEDPELFMFNESFDANLFKLKRGENSMHHLNSTYDISCNFELLNDLNKLYKNANVKINKQQRQQQQQQQQQNQDEEAIYEDTLMSGTQETSHTLDFFYENDLHSLKLNSMHMDMEINNHLEQQHYADSQDALSSDRFDSKNTTNAFIDMIMMADNMDFTEEADEYIQEEEEEEEDDEFDSINFDHSSNEVASSASSSAISSTSSLSSLGFHASRPITRSPSAQIKMQNSYGLLKRRIMGAHKRKHLHNYSLNIESSSFSAASNFEASTGSSNKTCPVETRYIYYHDNKYNIYKMRLFATRITA